MLNVCDLIDLVLYGSAVCWDVFLLCLPSKMCFDKILIGEVCDYLHFDCYLLGLGTEEVDDVFLLSLTDCFLCKRD